MTSNRLNPETLVSYYPEPGNAQAQVSTVRRLLQDCADGVLPEDTLVEVAPGQGFQPVRELVRRHPHLVHERTRGLQVAVLVISLLLAMVAFAGGRLAGVLQSLLFALVLLGILWLRRHPLQLGKSPSALRRSWTRWPHRLPLLAVVVLLEGVVAVSAGLHLRTAAALSRQLSQALAAQDPCTVQSLDPEQVRRFASRDLQARFASARSSCLQHQATAQTKAREQERCQQVVASIQGGTPISEPWLSTREVDLLQRLAKDQLAAEDLRQTPGSLLCGEALWPLLVERAQHSSRAWRELRDSSEVAQDLRVEMKTRKLAAGAVEALRQRATESAGQALKVGTIADLQQALGLCALVEELTGDKAPARCRDLPARLKSVQAQEEAKRKRTEAQEEAKRRLGEQQAERELERIEREDAMCEALRAKVEACHRRCDDLPLEVGLEAVERCEARCEQRLPPACQ